MELNFEDKLIANIKKNILWVLENFYDSNQTFMAKELDVKVNTLNTYINGDTKPPITFLYRVCKENNITLDSFVSENFKNSSIKSKKKDIIKAIYSKYEGKYYGYFYVIDSNSLKEGLIQEATITIGKDGICAFEIEKSEKSFNGNLTMSDDLVYLDMKNSREKINITFKNPGKTIKEHYKGGIGIINISSPEDNRIPSSQKIVLSKWKISVESYFNTLKEFLDINMQIKIKKKILLDAIKESLNMEKAFIIKALIDDEKVSIEDKLILDINKINAIYNIVEKQDFLNLKEIIKTKQLGNDVLMTNSIKISLEENKFFYRFIKNEFERRNNLE